MKKDTYITEVIFRKWRSNNYANKIIALFPYAVETLAGSIMSYEHIGQHGGADYNHCINMTTPAKAEEYKDLKEELESIGYNLKVVKKHNHKRFLQELNKVRNRNK